MDTLIQVLGYPYSVLLAVSYLLTLFAVHHFASGTKAIRIMTSVQTARILMAVGGVMLAIEGTWGCNIHRSVFFALYVLVLMASLAMVIIDGFGRKAKVGFLLNHLGIFLVIWGAFFGSPDVSRSRMIVAVGQPQSIAYSSEGKLVPMPFEVSLDEFRIDYYPDSVSPRQYTSFLTIGGEHIATSVNDPASYQGYTIYQDSYDSIAEQYTVLQVVRDPWLPIVYIGMVLLAVGSILLLFGRWKVRLVLPVTLVLTLLFTVLTVARINFGTLMPALRSWWFVPHLFIYMVAYSLMALALVMWLIKRMKGNDQWLSLSNNLVRSSSALLIIGMLTGSVWARQAWGDYWAWDAKENWAAVTWFVSLMHLHLQDKRGWRAITILLLAFLALQITWYGVNYLPSAVDSLHTYNH